LGEFLFMFPKDATGAQMFEGDAEGPQYLLASATGVIPSQLLPGKLESPVTDVLLSRQILGPIESARGAGVAGSAIADGFRAGGMIGVLLSAALLGSLLGTVNRWFNSPRTSPTLLKVALFAGYLSLVFWFVRGDFGSAFTLTIYNVVVPSLLLRALFSGRLAQQWLTPLIPGQARSP
jgi:hypothetical protein